MALFTDCLKYGEKKKTPKTFISWLELDVILDKKRMCQPCLISPFKREQEHVNILGEGKQLCKTE